MNNERSKLSLYQASVLMIIGILPTAILTVPNSVIVYSREAAWMSTLLASAIQAVIAVMLGMLVNRYDGLTLFGALRKHTGAAFSCLVGLMLTLYYFVSLIHILFQFVEFVREKLINRTPSLVICMVVMLVVVYAVDRGLVAMSNVSGIFIVISFIAMFLSTFLYLNLMHPSWMLPLTANPFNRIVQGTISPLSWLSEIAIILLIAPNMKQPEKSTRLAVILTLLCGFAITWVILGAIMILGTQIPRMLNYPTFSIFGIVEIGEFVQRIDVLFVAIWTGTMFFKTAIHFYLTVYCLKETFSLTRERLLYFPISWMACLYATKTGITVIKVLSTYNLYSQFFNVVVPALAALETGRRMRKGRQP